MNIGLVYFKEENNNFVFLLGKRSLDSDLYSDLGGYLEEDNFDLVKTIFNDNTFNLIDLSDDNINYNFQNDKYKYKLYFLENNVSDSVIETVNKVRNNINKSKDFDLRWFKLDEILDNKQLFEKEFFNTFIKSVKKYKDNFIKV